MKNIVRNSVALICCSALLFLASCEKDNLDDTNTIVTSSNDCEELVLNFGDVCEGEGFTGVVNQNCECVESNTIEFDCEDLQANIGDSCQNGWGTVSADCECVENSTEFHCPDFYGDLPLADVENFNVGDDCEIFGPGGWGDFLGMGTVSVDCECVESNSFDPDCPEFYFEGWSDGNYGSPCETAGVPQFGIIGGDCECIEDPSLDCPGLGNIGDECAAYNQDGLAYQGTVGYDCDCLENSPQDYTIDGRWLWSPGPTIEGANTMYEYSNGVRYTYYCGNAECDEAYWNSLEISDAIPGTENYTFEDGVLTVDLNFGNELVTPLTFECDGDKVIFSNGVALYRIGSDCD